MAEKIYKYTFEVVVLAPEPIEFEALDELYAAMSEGELIGQWSTPTPVAIEGEAAIRDELLAIGNDGTFFDHSDL